MKQYRITGMSCAACSARVERAVSSLEGVNACSVNLLTNSMTVESSLPDNDIIEAVRAAGYGAFCDDGGTAQKSADTEESAEQRAIIRRLCISAVFLALLMYISMGHSMLGAPLPSALEEMPLAIGIIQAVLSGAVLVINRRFFISGARGLLHGAPNMDTLVSIGSGASYIYSTAILFIMGMEAGTAEQMHYLHGLYFESAAMILTLITVGKLLEAHSKGKTTTALKALMKLAPETAVVLLDGREITVDISRIKVGDIFIVRTGDTVPVDGVVVEGAGAVDESALTGESIPADKSAQDKVYAASKSQNGYLVCRATGIGADTALSRIIKMVADASATKAPIAKTADRVSGIFVPVVISISVLTTLLWTFLDGNFGHALVRGISVLVISCPCALGLATPVAIMVGSGRGALSGILFKNATALEETGKIKTVALDKTGTLTYGAPAVCGLYPDSGTDEHELLSLAYSLEKKSGHPLAGAVVKYAENVSAKLLECYDVDIKAGAGISGVIGTKTVFGGNMKTIEAICAVPESAKTLAESLSDQGKTPLFFSYGGAYLGIIAVADEIRDEAAEAIDELRKLNIETVMLTGDNERTANAAAKKLGIDRVIAGVMPDGKENAVRELRAHGAVLMVGDGINDAPALTAADVGMAIGAGTQVAIDSADVVLTNSSPLDIVQAIRLSRATMRNIRENLFWAFFYNMAGIPLAAGLFIPLLGWELEPMFGAAAMSLSSFCVVSNALRLNFVKLDKKPKAAVSSDSLHIILKIKGMMCGHCEARVKSALEAVDGVISVNVSYKTGTAAVTLSSPVDAAMLKNAVESQGYKVKRCN